MGNSNDRLDNEIESFYHHITPYGIFDISKAVETAIACGYDGKWVAEQVEQFSEDNDTNMKDIDVVYVVYDALFQEVKSDIEKLTNIDICNDLDEEISIYGDYMCTTFNYTDGAFNEIKEVLNKINKDDFTDVMNWFANEIDYKKSD
jgi:hypothetical protein